jgi:hypothetical protein
MKKIFFPIMAIAMLSTAAFAGNGGKGDAKRHKTARTCPANCPPNCPPCPKGGGNCPQMPGGAVTSVTGFF